ncbi:MAG TPA: carbohydrate ABC transporter permease [Thermoanaerobacterales bacterium]|jgi:raffinose/stachyose/melibiose transport system permease protein|nr:carbohydrate ABC transporter permease [Thermoanaerobacterales bacterium]
MIKRRISSALKPSHILLYTFLFIGSLTIFFPMYLTIVTAFKTPAEISKNFFTPPQTVYLDNFKYIIKRSEFLVYTKNSAIVTVVSIALISVITPMTSYAIARNMSNSRFYKGLYMYILLALFVPFQVIMLPLVFVLQRIRLMNLIGLIICYLSFALPQAVFLYTGYIRSVPLELEESAFIDGCSVAQTFFRIVYPLIMPMTATIIILNALWIWNDFLLPLLVLNKSSKIWTIPLFIFNFKSQYSFEANLAFAAFLLALVPIMILYAFMQKYIIDGLTKGALKG